MSTITVETECGKYREVESRREAEEAKRDHESLCDECDADAIRIERRSKPSPRHAPDDDPGTKPPSSASLPGDVPESVRTDPLDVVPDYMVTDVEGQPTINKRGYAVIAHHFDVVVQSEAITTAGETDHEYAEFGATAWKKEDGPERCYTGHGTARASEDRRGIENNLNEMAETRAMKRAVAWASGVGLLAWEEMVEYVDED